MSLVQPFRPHFEAAGRRAGSNRQALYRLSPNLVS